MAVDLVGSTFGAKAKSYYYNKKSKHFALYPEAYYLIIRFPTFEMGRICSCLVILVLVVAPFTIINSSFTSRTSLDSTVNIAQKQDHDPINMDGILTLFFHDLTKEGLMSKTQSKAIFLSNEQGSQIVTDYSMDHIPLTDSKKQNSLLDDSVDFVYTTNFPTALEFIDRTLRTGGVATVVLNGNPPAAFSKPSNYKIAYTMKRFNLIAVAMKKTGPASLPKLGAQRKLLGYASDAKKAALQNLEDVLLEPPRAASGKSRVYLKRTRYLPNLMGDSLESYPRRVFINVGLPEKNGGSGTDWFHKNYPTRNKNFEMYKIETVSEWSLGKGVPQIEMSDWLRKNVKDEEYVVMKAEAEVVEEMMRSKAIMLVDELFLECKPRSSTRGSKQGNDGNNRRSRRAYWECLALYGKLRDEGVAVHQWWG